MDKVNSMDIEQIKALSDEDFEALQSAVLEDQRRRFTLRQIPADIAELAAQYRESGGSEDDLAAAVAAPED